MRKLKDLLPELVKDVKGLPQHLQAVALEALIDEALGYPLPAPRAGVSPAAPDSVLSQSPSSGALARPAAEPVDPQWHRAAISIEELGARVGLPAGALQNELNVDETGGVCPLPHKLANESVGHTVRRILLLLMWGQLARGTNLVPRSTMTKALRETHMFTDNDMANLSKYIKASPYVHTRRDKGKTLLVLSGEWQDELVRQLKAVHGIKDGENG